MRTTEKGRDTEMDGQCENNNLVKKTDSQNMKPGQVKSNGASIENVVGNMGSLSISSGSTCEDQHGTDDVSGLTRGLDGMTINSCSQKEPAEEDRDVNDNDEDNEDEDEDEEDEFLSKGPPGVASCRGGGYGNFPYGDNRVPYNTMPQSNHYYYEEQVSRRLIGRKSQNDGTLIYDGTKSINIAMSGGSMMPTGPMASPNQDPGSFSMFDQILAGNEEGFSNILDQQEVGMSPLSDSNHVMAGAHHEPAWENALSPDSFGTVYPQSPDSMYSSVGSVPASDMSNCSGFSPSRDDIDDLQEPDSSTVLDDIEQFIKEDLEKQHFGSDESNLSKEAQSKQIAIKQIADELHNNAQQSLPPVCQHFETTINIHNLPKCAHSAQNIQQPFTNGVATEWSEYYPVGHGNQQIYPDSTTLTCEQLTSLMQPQFPQNNLSPVAPTNAPMTTMPLQSNASNANVFGPATTGAKALYVTQSAPNLFLASTTGQNIVVPPTSFVALQLPQPQPPCPIKAELRKILPKPPCGVDGSQVVPVLPRNLSRAVPIKASVNEQWSFESEEVLSRGSKILAKARSKCDQISDQGIFLQQDEDGDSKLMISVDSNNLALVFAIVARCKNFSPDLLKQVLDLQDGGMQTALYKALRKPKIMCVLLTSGADPTLMAHFTRNGSREWRAPLHYCAYYGDDLIDSTCLLLAAQKERTVNFINNKSTESWTPLHYAAMEHRQLVEAPDGTTCKKDCTATIHTLIQEGANINIKDDRSGLTPMHYIIKTGDVLLIESVLDMLEPDMLQDALMLTTNANEETCLHLAVQLRLPDEKKVTLVQLLINCCPNLVPMRMRSGNRTITAQGLIQKSSNPKVFEVLSKARSNQSRSPSH